MIRIRQISPGMIVTGGADVLDSRAVAIVYQSGVNSNSGKAYPTTPGHFEQVACAP